jgi:hypothetical protein
VFRAPLTIWPFLTYILTVFDSAVLFVFRQTFTLHFNNDSRMSGNYYLFCSLAVLLVVLTASPFFVDVVKTVASIITRLAISQVFNATADISADI